MPRESDVEDLMREVDELTKAIEDWLDYDTRRRRATRRTRSKPKRKRKLSAWQKYIKNKRNHIKYRDGKLNLKKMGVAFRRKQRR